MTDTGPARAPALGTVLLIDDDTFFQMACERMMKRSGLVGRLIAFSMAEEALAFLGQPDAPVIDAVFLDVNMPRMNGLEFLEAAVARFGPGFAGRVVLMLTSALNPRDAARAEASGAVHAYAEKPLTLDLIGTLAAEVAGGARRRA